MRLLVSFVLVGATAAVASAYPQFQLSRDQTCTGCHISPAGGNLLNENGYSVAESISQFGTQPETFYKEGLSTGKLQLGGDVRLAAGYFDFGGSKDTSLYAFPMQVELYAHLQLAENLAFHANGGLRTPQTDHAAFGEDSTVRAATFVWSREHYLMYQTKPGENEGLYIRVGRFQPVFGLRFAEHPLYTRRFGGTQLFSDTYGASVSHVTSKLELHATGFIEDYLIDPVEHANGGALYGEYRASETLQFGGGVMFKNFTNGDFLFSDTLDSEFSEIRVALTNKLYLSGPDLLFSTELQFVNGIVDKVDRSPASAVGGAPKGIVGNVTVSRMLGTFLLLDVGLGHYDPNYRIANLDRDCVDLNLHWFATSHAELILNTRYETLGFGKGGESGAYAMLQAHYRL